MSKKEKDMKRLCNQHGYETKTFNACPFYDEGHEGKLANYILGYKKYGILWQRDFNARRPEAFTREITIEETLSLPNV
ncbi:hypothetical protein RO3G_03339 [Rhizopus delemar RA 99-880]|uniref:Uncharacterized protein n=1 Tax=Rhizopus delemar (strain RA 99-880 / ATCC MYA-4621 / FGSC 9543 / NRRL 43880) TaxID=246409 RepID=I1BR05_RHIO9|nr:hypothetical protein RO3G_03339 [Rhizopus delemar RA 99-880]|eukprot:EIE78635.1 hypothetical protein RO3G_03339 [Rhizopus delemar RA 99-880]